MKPRKPAGGDGVARDRVEMQMTPMIDIVFQLLVFFIMSFKIATPEGDFAIKMPQRGGPPTSPEVTQQTLHVKLAAAPGGDLAGVQFERRPLEPPYKQSLRQAVIEFAGGSSPQAVEDIEIELDCDYELDYQHVMMAITAISGYVDQGQIVKLVEKIKLAPPARAPGS